MQEATSTPSVHLGVILFPVGIKTAKFKHWMAIYLLLNPMIKGMCYRFNCQMPGTKLFGKQAVRISYSYQ